MSGPNVPSTPSTPVPPHEPPTLPPAPSLLDRVFLTGVPDVTEVLLVRHGQQVRPDGRRGHRGNEQPDAPLSPTGERQAALLGSGLAGAPIEAVYCSTLLRARQTAAAIAAHHDVEPVVLEELRELELFRDVPDGKVVTDLVARSFLRGADRRFGAERRWDVFPFSETGGELRHRVVTTVEGIIADHPGGRVAVACHGGVLNAYLLHVLGVDEDMFFNPAHASVSRVLARHGTRVVHTVNETHHLAASGEQLVTY